MSLPFSLARLRSRSAAAPSATSFRDRGSGRCWRLRMEFRGRCLRPICPFQVVGNRRFGARPVFGSPKLPPLRSAVRLVFILILWRPILTAALWRDEPLGPLPGLFYLYLARPATDN